MKVSDQRLPKAGRKERDSNLELLRILATLFVVILHYNNKNSGKAFAYTEAMAQHYQILLVFELLAISAVDIFVMISGYFMCNSRKVEISKVLRLYVDVIFCSVLRYLVNCALHANTFSIGKLIYFMIPLNWYVAIYAALFLISPYLNKVIRGMTAKQFRTMLVVCVFLFSIWPSALEGVTAVTGQKTTSLSTVSIQGSGAGYTIVNFVLMYYLGAYLRMHKISAPPRRVIPAALGAYGLCTVGLLVYSRIHYSGSLSYCNPLVIGQAVALFCVFQSFTFRNRFINTISGCSFGVYLLHSFFFRYAQIERFVTGALYLIPLHVVGSAVVIYCASAVVYWLYSKASGPVLNWISGKLRFLSYEID